MIAIEDFSDMLRDFINENCYTEDGEITYKRDYKENLAELYLNLFGVRP